MHIKNRYLGTAVYKCHVNTSTELYTMIIAINTILITSANDP